MTTRSVALRSVTLLLLLFAVISPLPRQAAAQDDESGLVSDTEYESPQYGFAVEWDDPWEALPSGTESVPDEDYDLLTLDSDMARVQVYATTGDGIAADAYIDALVDIYEEDATDFAVLDRTGDDEVAAAMVEYDLDGTLVHDYSEARIVDDVLISISLVAPVDDFADEVESAQEVIELDGDPIFAAVDDVDLDAAADNDDEADADESDADGADETASGDISPQYRGGPARTGEQPGPAPDEEPDALWTYETGDTFGSISPVIAGDFAYIGPNALYRVDIASGELDDSIKEQLGFVAPPAMEDGVVYATYEGGALYAIEADSGDTLWTFDIGANDMISGPAVADGMAYVATFSGTLYAIDEDGEEAWTASIESSLVVPTVADGVVYVAAGSPAVMYAFDAETGEELWSEEFADGQTYGTQAIADGIIYAPNESGDLTALDAEDGTVLWTAETGVGTAAASPAVADGVVYVTGSDNALLAFDAESGDDVWSADLDAVPTSQPVVVDGMILVGDEEGGFYALDAESGDAVWTTSLPDMVEGSPAVVDGVIYVDANGTLCALALDS